LKPTQCSCAGKAATLTLRWALPPTGVNEAFHHVGASPTRLSFTIGQGARVDATMATYRIGLQSSNGCGPSVTSIHTQDLSSSISVYPNPSTGLVSITANEGSKKLTYSIMNVLGENIWEISTIEKEIIIDLKDQPNGIYFLRTATQHESITKKIIVNK